MPKLKLYEKDGWVYLDKGCHRLYVEKPPRSKKIYLHQLAVDIKSYKTYLMLLPGIAGLYFGLKQESYYFFTIGVIFLSIYVYMFLRVTPSLVKASVVEGRIFDATTPHPIVRDTVITNAETREGSIPVVIEKAYLNAELNRGSALNVRILYEPKADYSFVIALQRS